MNTKELWREVLETAEYMAKDHNGDVRDFNARIALAIRDAYVAGIKDAAAIIEDDGDTDRAYYRADKIALGEVEL